MPESGLSTVVILLAVCAGLLFLLLLVGLRVAGRLGRIELQLGRSGDADDRALREALAKVPEPERGGAFEEFLSEDPARRSLPKAEQFAAYRQWRQEKGLNWSAS